MSNSVYKNYEVIGNLWLSQQDGMAFGMVKCKDLTTGERNYFVGTYDYKNCVNEWDDVCLIIDNGQKMSYHTLKNLINKGEYRNDKETERTNIR